MEFYSFVNKLNEMAFSLGQAKLNQTKPKYPHHLTKANAFSLAH